MTLSKHTLGIALAGIRSSVCDYDPGERVVDFQTMCDAAEAEIVEELNRDSDNGPRVWMSLECYEEIFKEIDRLRDYDMMYGPPAGEPIGMAKLIAEQKPIGPELAKHSSEVVDELLKADHIVDATKKVETPESREAWAAFEKLVEDSEPEETPEEAAERYADEFWDEEVNQYNELMRACGVSGWLAGVRWAEERSKK